MVAPTLEQRANLLRRPLGELLTIRNPVCVEVVEKLQDVLGVKPRVMLKTEVGNTHKQRGHFWQGFAIRFASKCDRLRALINESHRSLAGLWGCVRPRHF